ncbi:MAG: methyltransferase domain-containing protein [Pseudomonadales bacterium]|jgi:phospholipid N-methyltransferase|nr:methyltransferase domain-containing protein [Pseudomonadales bacterium]
MSVNFYRQVRRTIREDGMIMSSSPYLVNAMLDDIDFSVPASLLEVGSGKGVFTREIIRRMHPRSTLDVNDIKSEYNPWIEALIDSHPEKQVRLHNGCVTQLLQEREHYDVIVSSLPLKNLEYDPALLYRVLGAMRDGLKPGGVYLQYQYFRSNKQDVEKVFGKKLSGVDFVLLNVLPAFVYRMVK